MRGPESGDTARLSLRPLAIDDLDLLCRWLTEPEVATFYGDPSERAHVQAKFGPRARGQGRVRAHVIEAGGRAVGYAQHYLLSAQERDALGLPADRLWGGFDLFIADPLARGQGLAPQVVARLAGMLRAEGASAVAIDVWTENPRAIRLYTRVGLHVARRLDRFVCHQGIWRDH